MSYHTSCRRHKCSARLNSVCHKKVFLMCIDISAFFSQIEQVFSRTGLAAREEGV